MSVREVRASAAGGRFRDGGLSDADPQRAVDVIAPLGEKEKTMGMTAERLIYQGEAKGMATVLLRQIRLKFPQDVDAALEERVRSADPATLELWDERILTAESIEAVLD